MEIWLKRNLWPGPWATRLLDGSVEWKAGQEWRQVWKWNLSQSPLLWWCFNFFTRMSMMEALGQLAKDGSLLAPAHKHIGTSVLLDTTIISILHGYAVEKFFSQAFLITKRLWGKLWPASYQPSTFSRFDKIGESRKRRLAFPPRWIIDQNWVQRTCRGKDTVAQLLLVQVNKLLILDVVLPLILKRTCNCWLLHCNAL